MSPMAPSSTDGQAEPTPSAIAQHLEILSLEAAASPQMDFPAPMVLDTSFTTELDPNAASAADSTSGCLTKSDATQVL
jgi:hypothetical protein